MGAVRHRFTVDEYRKMGEAGIFGEDDRVELMDGEVVRMAAIGDRHFECVYRLTQLLSRWVLLDAPRHYDDVERIGVSVQNPLVLSVNGEPQPDLTLLQRRGDRSGVPLPEEALLVVEVADTSLRYDREVKLPAYAAAGTPETWLVDLNAEVIQAHSEPGPEGYGKKVARFGRGQELISATVQGLAFGASEALPPER